MSSDLVNLLHAHTYLSMSCFVVLLVPDKNLLWSGDGDGVMLNADGVNGTM